MVTLAGLTKEPNHFLQQLCQIIKIHKDTQSDSVEICEKFSEKQQNLR